MNSDLYIYRSIAKKSFIPACLYFVLFCLSWYGLQSVGRSMPYAAALATSFFVVMCLRIALSLAFEKMVDKNLRAWKWIFSLLVCYNSLTWSLFCASELFQNGLGSSSMIFLFPLAGIAGGAVIFFSPLIWFGSFQLCVLLLPTVVTLGFAQALGSPRASEPVYAGVILVYLIYLLIQNHYLASIFAREMKQSLVIRKQRDELVVANAKAQVAEDAKSRFLGMISHEIRTPLIGIIGVSDLLTHEKDQTHLVENLRMIHSSGENLLVIVNDILNYSSLAETKEDYDLTVFDLNANLRDAVRPFESIAYRKRIELKVISAGEMPETVIGDKSRVKQLLVNLLSNAIKFTEQGEIVVNIRVDHNSPEKHDDLYRIHLSVKDSGVGIDPAKIQTIFDLFSQADNSNTRRFGGAGIGLAVCKKICESMGGSISVKSSPEGGSEFSCSFLMRAAKAEAEPMAVLPAQQRILLVEDNLVTQMLTKVWLVKSGFDVDIANNGVEAIEACMRRRYQLIIMDCQMPQMDGLEATIKIRSIEVVRAVPIIGYTANVHDNDRQRCLEAGMDDYIAKPASLETLQSTVLKWIPVGQRRKAS